MLWRYGLLTCYAYQLREVLAWCIQERYKALIGGLMLTLPVNRSSSYRNSIQRVYFLALPRHIRTMSKALSRSVVPSAISSKGTISPREDQVSRIEYNSDLPPSVHVSLLPNDPAEFSTKQSPEKKYLDLPNTRGGRT